jgi:PAS domain S-box-containing protein
VKASLANLNDKPYATYHEERAETIKGWRWFGWSAKAILGNDGKIKEIVSIGRDITERKQIEKSLREYKLFLDNISDIAYVANTEGIVTYANPATTKITGLPLEEIIGLPFLPIFVERDHQSLIDVFHRTLSGESLKNTLTFNSGVTCHFTSLPLKDKHGNIVGTFGIARDICDRLKYEKALKESEARLQKAQSVANIGNWEYDI